MAYERDEFEIDFQGGRSGFEWETAGELHAAPFDINFDRPDSSFTPSPRIKQSSAEGGARVFVMRREDLITNGIYAVRVIDKAREMDVIFPAPSIVSRIIHQERGEEMIWYKQRGRVDSIIVSSQSVLEKYEKRI